MSKDTGGLAKAGNVFATTHWSVVLMASQAGSPDADKALEQICGTYWYPLYAYARAQGRTPEDAQDLTQDFFVRFLDKNYIRLANPARGRLRSFLLTSFKHFLTNEWTRGQRQKRGGSVSFVCWEEPALENRYLNEPVDALSPEKLFEKRWAVALLEQVLARLRQEETTAGRGPIFEELRAVLWGDRATASYAELGAAFGLTEAAVKVAVHRLRRCYRELLRAEIARTVGSPEHVDEELRELMAVLRG